ncbi:MAG: hypothetical protein LUG56_08310 [Lachnospiraceae bacterium]|nr:hypothetical protein [Lachnospiraceae bacterium]MCD7842454.1 hypothetical protein [Lachnospiraceae bacterium]
MSIMNSLFDGKIYPGEQIVPANPEYDKTNREIDALMKKLEERLDKEEYDMVEELCDLLSVSEDIQNKEIFRYGMSMGLRLMREAYESPWLREEKEQENA